MEWISVKDRLPKEYEYVLAIEGEAYEVVFMYEDMDESEYGIRWSDPTYQYTHWMPLPKPPIDKCI